jgi:glycosyltransferase involved in cell wall biosynthesis
MDEKKKKIGIIVAELKDTTFLDVFEPLCNLYDIAIFTLNDEKLTKICPPAFKIKIFKEINEMPGYMRNLEHEFRDLDLIISTNLHHLSSYQALRISLRQGIPLLAYLEQFQPEKFAQHPNIRAVEGDLIKGVQHFFATSPEVSQKLVEYSVDQDKVTTLRPSISSSYLPINAYLRAKFRKYAGINEDDYVILFKGDLDEKSHLQDLIEALRLIRLHDNKIFQKLKLLFVGSGPAADALKYEGYELGMAKNIRFIHQDPREFIFDIYYASDFAFAVDCEPGSCRRWLLEAMVCGVSPIRYNCSHCEGKVEGIPGLNVTGNFQDLANTLTDLLRDAEPDIKWREESHDFVVAEFSSNEAATMLLNEIKKLTSESASPSKKDTFNQMLDEINHAVAKNDPDALAFVDKGLLQVGVEEAYGRAILLTIKGNILLKRGKYKEAGILFDEAASLDPSDFRAPLGLGQIAFASFAYEEAIQNYRKVLAINSNCYEALIGTGLVFKNINMHGEAIYWFEKAVLCSPTSLKAVLALSQSCLAFEESRYGIQILSRMRDTLGDVPCLTLALGQLLIKDGQVNEGKMLVNLALMDQDLRSDDSKKAI